MFIVHRASTWGYRVKQTTDYGVFILVVMHKIDFSSLIYLIFVLNCGGNADKNKLRGPSNLLNSSFWD